MLLAMSKGPIYFAAGTPERRCSTVWRLWSSRNSPDVYLASRSSAHIFKTSLHGSGVWTQSFTTQSGIAPDGNRRTNRWDRPDPFQPQWTRGPAVVIPWVDWLGGAEYPEEDIPDATVWVPCPGPGTVVTIATLFAETPDADLEINATLDDRQLGHLDVVTGERVWLVSALSEMSTETKAAIDNRMAAAQPFPALDWGWGIYVTTAREGVPAFLQFPLPDTS